MTTTKITSQEVSDWMQEQLAEALKLSKYGDLKIQVNGFRESNEPTRFSIYLGNDDLRDARDMDSFESCFEFLEGQPIKTKADLKRDQAAKLLAEADAIEAATL